MNIIAYREHAIPGRLRLSVPSRTGDGGFFETLAQHLSRVSAIETMTTSCLMGGVVIRHKGAAADLKPHLQDFGGLLVRPPPPVRTRGVAGTPALNRASIGLVGLGTVQALRGQFTGSAAENFWNAYRAQNHLGKPWLSVLFGGLGLVQLANGQILNSATALMFYAATAQQIAREDPSSPSLGGEMP